MKPAYRHRTTAHRIATRASLSARRSSVPVAAPCACLIAPAGRRRRGCALPPPTRSAAADPEAVEIPLRGRPPPEGGAVSPGGQGPVPGGDRPAQLHRPEQPLRRDRHALPRLGPAARQGRLCRAAARQPRLARARQPMRRCASARCGSSASASPTPTPRASGCSSSPGSGRPGFAARLVEWRDRRALGGARAARRRKSARTSAPRSRSIRAAAGSATTAWSARVPTLILIGRADDQASAAVCQQMVAGARGRSARVAIHVYPGAHHDFDHPNRPLRLRTGLAFSVDGSGRVPQRHRSGRPRRRAPARAGVAGAVRLVSFGRHVHRALRCHCGCARRVHLSSAAPQTLAVIAGLEPAIHDDDPHMQSVRSYCVEPLHGCPGQARA